MPLSAEIRQRCRTFLLPDTRIRYAFPAMLVASGATNIGPAPIIVVVTDSETVLLSCGLLHRHRPNSLWARYSRGIRFGPVSTSLAPTFSLGRLLLETDEEYASVVRAADEESARADYLPPDPLPDL